MARAAILDPTRRTAREPLYDVDTQTGASVEVFHADSSLAKSFGARGAGWFWWTCRPGRLPDGLPTGPFATSYAAYRNVAMRWMANTTSFAPIASPLLPRR